MEYNPFCITKTTSDIAEKVSEVIQNAKRSASSSRSNHLSEVIAKIADLESRGLIKRQQYQSPTTADFERNFACIKKQIV